MAYVLTSEELIEQAKMLTTKTDSSTNPNMSYSSIVSRNTGLNPNYFTGNYTTIVNALNLTMKKAEDSDSKVTTFGEKLKVTIGDTSSVEMAEKFENLKTLMGQNTIIEGLIDLYNNQLVSKDNVTAIVNENVQTAIDEKLCWVNENQV